MGESHVHKAAIAGLDRLPHRVIEAFDKGDSH